STSDMLCYYTLYLLAIVVFPLFLYTPTSPTAIYTLSLHDALPICPSHQGLFLGHHHAQGIRVVLHRRRKARTRRLRDRVREKDRDRKSTRLNSSHLGISYAVFCLKKKKNKSKQSSQRA